MLLNRTGLPPFIAGLAQTWWACGMTGSSLFCCFRLLHVKLYHAQPSPGCLHSTSASPSTNKTCIYGISAYYRVKSIFSELSFKLLWFSFGCVKSRSRRFWRLYEFPIFSTNVSVNKRKQEKKHCFIGSWAWPQKQLS